VQGLSAVLIVFIPRLGDTNLHAWPFLAVCGRLLSTADSTGDCGAHRDRTPARSLPDRWGRARALTAAETRPPLPRRAVRRELVIVLVQGTVCVDADHAASLPRRQTLQNVAAKGDKSGDKEAVSTW